MKTLGRAKAMREWKLYFFLFPSLVMILIFAYLPVFSGVFHSFYEWDGGNALEPVGLGHFKRLLSDAVFWQAFVTIGILVLANVIKLAPSILVAVLIHRLKSARAQYLYRIAVVLPMVVPGIVTLFVWKFFFDPNFGFLNSFLEATGLKALMVELDQWLGWGVIHENLPIAWLATPELIVPSLVLWGFPWMGSVGVLVYLAGLQAIGSEIYEAADLDGAGPFRKFWAIEFPLIMTQVRITLILLIIGTLQSYGQQYVLLGENGGAGRAGMTPGLWMFNRAFFAGEFGYACALGIALFAVILALTWVNNKYVRVDK